MFHSARIKLTLWYLLIIMIISVSFSAVIYRVLVSEVERFANSQRFRIERQLKENSTMPPNIRIPANLLPIIADPELVEEMKNRLLMMLMFINSGILIISGGLGFILAGKTLKPIQDMLDEQNQFITDASHELRTPLTSLKSAMEVNLRDTHLTLSQTKKILEENIEEVNKLQRLSDELLELSQYQKPNGTHATYSLSWKEILTKTVREITPLAKQKNITIKTIGSNATIVGTSQDFSTLITILLENAIKYGKPKSVITITSSTEKHMLTFSVQDEGIGIDTKDIPHIFDRFYRTDSARMKTEKGGYGLGLSIAKKIIDQYHGSIQVKSAVGKGSTFTVQLPL